MVHLSGNDVLSPGPALLVAGSLGGDLISLTASGNSLRSLGNTGAVYLRQLDALNFSGNRCEALSVVNVVVVRSVDALVTIGGNLVLGTEPVQPPTPPKQANSTSTDEEGGVSLNVDLPGGGRLKVPLDTDRLTGNLEAFSDTAKEAFARVLTEKAAEEQVVLSELSFQEADAQGEESVTEERSAELSSSSLEAAKLMATAAPKYEIKLSNETLTGTKFLEGIRSADLSSRDIEAAVRGTKVSFESELEKQEVINELNSLRKSKATQEVLGRPETQTSAAKTVYSRIQSGDDSQAESLAKITRLFAAKGYSAAEAAAETRVLLERSSSDARAAYETLEQEVLGTEEARPATADALRRTSLLERVLSEDLFRRPTVVNPPKEPEPEPAPDPYQHSLVIIGGARVTAIGNTTTAGALVLHADEYLANNL